MSRLPLFPVSVVGSWPRPKWLLEALKAKREKRITEDEFEKIADESVLLAIKYQEDAGVDILTDGEQRRDNFYSFVADKIEGIELKTVAEIVDLTTDKSKFEHILRTLDVPAFAIRNPVAISKLKIRRHLALDDFKFTKKHTNKLIKVTLPGPYMLTRAAWVPGITNQVYSSRDELAQDIVKVLRTEVISLKDEGAFFIQFDEPVLMEVLYGVEASQQTFMCAALVARENPRDELLKAIELINETVKGISGVKLGIHVCRGNWSKKEEALLKGDYEPLLPFLMEMKVDQLVLEFATPRAGEIDVFKDYTDKKELGLGVVNPRTDYIESPEEIIKKAHHALKYFDPDKIYLNPDCGFGTFAEAPVNTPLIAFEKLKSISKAAEKLRQEYGSK
jgi:5-methyltetrahydropteroyltriglutamate--homocysteine methyltransferase